MVQKPKIEVAALADAELLEDLIERSARGLCVPDYTSEQIESALGSVWGLDTQLIEDQTYSSHALVPASSHAEVGAGGRRYSVPTRMPAGVLSNCSLDEMPLAFEHFSCVLDGSVGV
jgi:hypothetical protein